MSRVFIVGAGFSKALANAPLTYEIVEKIYKIAKSKLEIDRNANSFIKLIDILRTPISNAFKSPLFSEEDSKNLKNRDQEQIPLSIDIEFLFTIIDLNLLRPFIPNGKGVDYSSVPIPYLDGLNSLELEKAKVFLKNEFVKLLLPDSLSPKKNELNKFTKFLNEQDKIITFNYDLLLEQNLWNEKLWNPLDGYFIGKVEEENYLSIKKPETLIPIIKLHGSINWQERRDLSDYIKISLESPISSKSYFSGIELRNEPNPIPEHPLTSFMTLPSFIKSFSKIWEHKLIKIALEYLSNANEIITLGYSFPNSDSMTNFLMSQLTQDVKIKIVDKQANDIKERLEEEYQFKNIEPEQIGIEEWIKNEFQYKEFEKYTKNQRFIRSILS
ncbi:MAG: hypothetical protein DWQ06_08960 [Calditrichaeota bacterium]|nr:MAG: hypothetical protein DWQ06_08960 [Calditrichota bacterium]